MKQTVINDENKQYENLPSITHQQLQGLIFMEKRKLLSTAD
jgi:hypothetical protein